MKNHKYPLIQHGDVFVGKVFNLSDEDRNHSASGFVEIRVTELVSLNVDYAFQKLGSKGLGNYGSEKKVQGPWRTEGFIALFYSSFFKMVYNCSYLLISRESK